MTPSDRIFFNGKYHTDVFFNGHYHKEAWMNGECVWRKKVAASGENEIDILGITWYKGIFYILERKNAFYNNTSTYTDIYNIYTGNNLLNMKLRYTEYFYHSDTSPRLYFIECNEDGLSYALGNYPGDARITLDYYYCSFYRRIMNINAEDYTDEITDKPAHTVQCKDYGVIFDTSGNYYYSYTTSNLNTSKLVGIMKHEYEECDFSQKIHFYPGNILKTSYYAKITLPSPCLHTFAFLSNGRINICAAPKYTHVVENPEFYIVSVGVNGDGSDAEITELGNQQIIYDDEYYMDISQQVYPMMLGSSDNDFRVDFITEKIRALVVKIKSGMRWLFIDFEKCEIIKALQRTSPYKGIVHALKYNGVSYIFIRSYEDGISNYYLYYGEDLLDLNECSIASYGSDSLSLSYELKPNKQSLFIKSDNLYISDSTANAGANASLLKLSLVDGTVEDYTVMAKY